MPLWVPGLEKVIYSRYNKYRQRNEGVSSVKDGTPLFITDIIQGVLTMRNNLIKVAAAVPELKIGVVTYRIYLCGSVSERSAAKRGLYCSYTDSGSYEGFENNCGCRSSDQV